ncbi:hypothetical protein M9458_008739, partial [Cirrhinus mrigala]
MFWAEEILMNIQQAERLLEQYVEEFLSVIHLVSWSDAMINACFQIGLNDDKLFCSITADDCRRPVADFINYVLALCNSNFYVDVEDYNLPPICEHAAAPAHHQPASSTCCSNELTPSGPPLLTPVLQSSSLILSPEPAVRSRTRTAACSQTPAAASSRTPAAACSQTPAAASSRTPAMAPRSSKPATAPRSGFMPSNMASQIYHKDTMVQFGLLSPSSLLVPSSPPSSLLVPSRPPNRPEPESRSALQSLSFLRSALQSRRFLQTALQSRRCQSAPQSRRLPSALLYPPDPPWPSGLCTRPWLPELLDLPWPSGLCTRPWLPELPDPPWLPGLCTWPWLPELPDPPWHPGLYALPWLPKLPDPPWHPGLSLIHPGGVPPLPPV